MIILHLRLRHRGLAVATLEIPRVQDGVYGVEDIVQRGVAVGGHDGGSGNCARRQGGEGDEGGAPLGSGEGLRP